LLSQKAFPQLDENLNRKFAGGTFVSRAQDYSTTSLEFSDMESLVSDSLGRASDDPGSVEELGRTVLEERRGSAEDLACEPVSFVEFTPVNDESQDHARNTRSVLFLVLLVVWCSG